MLLSECCTAICIDFYIYFRPALCLILVYNCGLTLTVLNKRICYVAGVKAGMLPLPGGR